MDGQREGSALIAEQRRAVRYLTLNRPEVLNALNAGVFAALEEELARISSDSGTRAVGSRAALSIMLTGETIVIDGGETAR
jgi:enoyl-CoA hydratase/carnithine racemase